MALQYLPKALHPISPSRRTSRNHPVLGHPLTIQLFISEDMGHHTTGYRHQRPEEQVRAEGECHSCLEMPSGHHHRHHRRPLLQCVRLPGRDCSLLGTVCRVCSNADTIKQTADQRRPARVWPQASCSAWCRVKGTRWSVTRPPSSFVARVSGSSKDWVVTAT